MTKIIDGRKAEITSAGRRFSTYNGFAEAHGYPESAAVSDRNDSRKKPKNGDIVTLLTSGPHLSGYGGDTLWIIEAENGDRHIYNEKGLRVLDEADAPITVLPDESLGGVSREYREVKRKACVGERIKVTDGVTAGDGEHAVDEIKYVIHADRWSDGSGVSTSAGMRVAKTWSEGIGINHGRYVVLEASDTLVINNERFRLVDRKAAVGERVIVTNDGEHTLGDRNKRYYNRGDVALVENAGDDGNIRVDLTMNARYYDDGRWTVSFKDYAVLEPLASAASAFTHEPEPTPLSALPLVDQYAENITVLTRKIAQLEGRVETLEGERAKLRTLPKDVAQGVADMLADVDGTARKLSELNRPKSPQQIRDEIVERAAADVVELTDGGEYYRVPNGSFSSFICRADFIVNRDKRKVTVTLRGINSGKVRAVGRAVCAPGETFNSHIGRSIALHRALGLTVPAEYLTCPQPEEFRVGDVVTARPSGYLPGTSGPVVSITDGTLLYRHARSMRPDGAIYDFVKDVVVTDDSREDGGNSACAATASSALKGAA